MMADTLMTVSLAVSGIAGGACFVARYAPLIRVFLQSFFSIFHNPLHAIANLCRRVAQGIRTWITGQVKGDSVEEGGSPLHFIIGSVIYSILTVIFIICDLGLTALTLEAFGMGEYRLGLVDATALTAAAFITTSLFWGSVFTDIKGWTHLGPWTRNLSAFGKSFFRYFSLGLVLFCVAVGVLMALWRMEGMLKDNLQDVVVAPASAASSLITVSEDTTGTADLETGSSVRGSKEETEDDAIETTPPQRHFDWVYLFAPGAITGLCLFTTAFSAVGLMYLIKYLGLLAIALIGIALIAPAYLTGWLGAFVLERLFNTIQALMDIVAAFGASILRLFGVQIPDAEVVAPVPMAPASAPVNAPQPAPAAETAPPERGFNPF
ncbi:MAG: hypothetical protein AB2L22_12890 [Syntrophales bacterium]